MPNFRYVAKDKTGRNISGTAEASEEKALVDLLRKQELFVISVKVERKKEGISWGAKFGSKIKLGELVLFSRQLATMIDSGIPLVQALEILNEQIENPGFKKIISDVKKDVSTGTTFCDALAKHPRAFSPLFVNMVKAGEQSGSLDDIMERLASYMEKTDSLARKVKSAMVYPIVVSLMAVCITLVLMLKVVPVFKGIFADFGSELPLPTRILIFVSDGLIGSIWIWMPAVIIGISHF